MKLILNMEIKMEIWMLFLVIEYFILIEKEKMNSNAI